MLHENLNEFWREFRFLIHAFFCFVRIVFHEGEDVSKIEIGLSHDLAHKAAEDENEKKINHDP